MTNLESILRLDRELITLEQLEELELNALVEGTQDNGLSSNNPHYGKHWYTVYLNETFLSASDDDINEIQVYTE